MTATADAALLDALHALLATFWGQFDGWDATTRIAVDTAAAELVANIVEHARPRPPADVVTCTVTLRAEPDAVVVEAVTDALPTPPEALDPPDDLDPLAEAGRGVAIIRQLVELELRTTGDGNHWRLRRGLPTPEDRDAGPPSST